MKRSELFLLAATTLAACRNEPNEMHVPPQSVPVETTRTVVSDAVTKVTETPKVIEQEPELEIDSNVGTDVELQTFLHESRQAIRDDLAQNPYQPEAVNPSAKLFEVKLNELLNLQKLIDLETSDGADRYFTFSHSGKDISLSTEYGEGSSLTLSAGDERISFDIDGGLSEVTLDKASEKKAMKLLDFAIAGLKETLAAKPVYRAMKVDDPDVMANFGLNLRDEDGHMLILVPIGTIVQTLGIPNSTGGIFIYYIVGGQLHTGWVQEKYLEKKVLTSFSPKDAKETHDLARKMYVTKESTSNNGLNFRAIPSTDGRLLTKIPVGTEVVVTAMESYGESKWAQLTYTDPTTGITETGWACFYMTNSRFLEDVK